MTDDGPNAYTWDRANRLLSMGGSSYKYDGMGNRVSQTISSTVTRYLLDLQPGLVQVLRATTGGFSLDPVQSYVHGPRGIHAEIGGTDVAWRYTLQDGLGSVRGEIAPNMSVAASGAYEPYGEPTDVDGTFGQPFRFTGEMRDANTLQYHRARYYVPSQGIWSTIDPIQYEVVNNHYLNQYTWANSNPTNIIDPSGYISRIPNELLSCYEIMDVDADDICDAVSVLKTFEIPNKEIHLLGQEVFLQPRLFAAIVENEYQNRGFELAFSSNLIRWISLFLTSGGYNPSFGISQIQEQLALSLIARHPYAFKELANLPVTTIGDRIHSDPLLALRLAAYHISDLYIDILWDLRHEEVGDAPVRITLGTGECYSADDCTISSQQLEDLIILSYNQGWSNDVSGILDRLRVNRSGTLDWHAGITSTIAANSSQIQQVRQHYEQARSCGL